VLSPGRQNLQRDREAKLNLYSRQGVDEYWTVDWRARTVEVYRQSGAGLQLVAELGDGDALTSPLLSGFSCPVARLWFEG
jgi:Uma2 family endonuclease